MKKYIIKDTNNRYFEQDFAGWSWQEEFRLAYKFRTLEDAMLAQCFIQDSGDECNIEELE